MTNTEQTTYRVRTETKRGKPGPNETTMDVATSQGPQAAADGWASELRGEKRYDGLTVVVDLPGGFKVTAKV